MKQFKFLASTWLNVFVSIMAYLWYRADFDIGFFETLSIRSVLGAAAISTLPVIRNWYNKKYLLYGRGSNTISLIKKDSSNEKK
jgi:hypothetical protein